VSVVWWPDLVLPQAKWRQLFICRRMLCARGYVWGGFGYVREGPDDTDDVHDSVIYDSGSWCGWYEGWLHDFDSKIT
jgi:hypothetical protein